MKRIVKYLGVLLIILVCIYGFWQWLQHKWATVIQKTTNAIVTELSQVEKLETVKKTFSKTIEGEQQLATFTPNIWIDDIVNSALFKEKMVYTVQWEVRAGYIFNDSITGNIEVSRDGTVTIFLGEPEIFWVVLTWELETSKLGITTQKDIDIENTLRAKAWEIMIQDALLGWILDEARDNTQAIIQNILLKAQIQIKEVIIAWTGNLE